MKVLVGFYSQTGNNAALAHEVAAQLGAPVHAIVETKPRTMFTTVLDMTLGRHPKLTPSDIRFEEYDLLLVFGPLWMFQLASPLRTFCRRAKGRVKRYGFVSVCGGALGPNTAVGKELVRRLGRSLAFHLELPTAHFGSNEGASEYTLTDHPDDLHRMADIVVTLVRGLRERPPKP